MTTVYVYVMNTMADWEVSYVMAELKSKRFFKHITFFWNTGGVLVEELREAYIFPKRIYGFQARRNLGFHYK